MTLKIKTKEQEKTDDNKKKNETNPAMKEKWNKHKNCTLRRKSVRQYEWNNAREMHTKWNRRQ